MTGFFTEGAIGNTAAEAEGTALIPSTTGEVLGAQFRQSLAENPASRLGRLTARNLGDSPTLTPEEATERFGVEGRLSFTEPTTERVAQDLSEFHRNSAIREDVIARRQTGIGTGAVARFGAGLAAAVIDPLNIASAFLPGVGQARVAMLLGGAARGAAGRALVRGISGGTQGFVGAAALEPLNYWLAQKDQDDYTMGDVLLNLAFGTALGGGLQSGIGLVRDRRVGIPAWSPEAREAALRQSIASVVEGRPVEAAAAGDLTAFRTARTELETWYKSQAAKAAEADRAAAQADSATSAMKAAADDLARLRGEATALLREASTVRTEAAMVADLTTEADALRGHMDFFDGNPGGVLKLNGREYDYNTATTLLGLADAVGDAELAVARAQSQAQGVGAVAERAQAAAEKAAKVLARQQDSVLRTGTARDAAAVAAKSRAGITLDLAARTIRRLAAQIRADLYDGEAFELASRLMNAPRERAQAVLDSILTSLSNKAQPGRFAQVSMEDIAASTSISAPLSRLQAGEQAAEARLLDSVRGTADPRDVAAERNAALLAEKAPKVEGSVADELAEAQRATQEIEAALKALDRQAADAEVAAGREAPAPDPEIEAAAALAKAGDELGKAAEAAAICMIGRA